MIKMELAKKWQKDKTNIQIHKGKLEILKCKWKGILSTVNKRGELSYRSSQAFCRCARHRF